MDEVLIVNSYLPCRGNHTLQEFQQEIDQLKEICQKYADLQIILAGDFNVDVEKHPIQRVTYFKSLLNDHNLRELQPISEPTLTHHNWTSTSKIDYILLSDKLLNSSSPDNLYKLLDHPSNTSTHIPLLIKIKIKASKQDAPGNKAIPPKR